jgi:hypothetical protein
MAPVCAAMLTGVPGQVLPLTPEDVVGSDLAQAA